MRLVPFIVAAALSATAAIAQQPLGAEFQVTGLTATHVSVSRAANGHFAIFWHDSGASNACVRGQLLGANGTPEGDPIEWTYLPVSQICLWPVSTHLADGRLLVSWAESATTSRLRARFIDSSGAASTPIDLVSSSAPAFKLPLVLADGPNILLGWNQSNGSGQALEVKGQSFGLDGVAVQAPTSIDVGGGAQISESLGFAAQPAGNRLFVMWRFTNPTSRVFGRIMSNEGVAEPLFELPAAPTGGESLATVIATAADEFVAFWSKGRDPTTQAVMARRYASDGAGLGSDIPVSRFAANVDVPSGAALPGGGFVVAWRGRVASDAPIQTVARAFDRDGLAMSPEVTLADAPRSSSGRSFQIASDASGDVVLARLTADSHVAARLFEAPLDFGDAPSPYPTSRATDGARHVAGGLRLGSVVDADIDGGDDDATWSDDEDGVVFPAPVAIGATAIVRVIASDAGRLDGWIDFGGDGSWSDDGDRLFDGVQLVAGENTLSFDVPAGAQTGTTWSRFRFSETGGMAVTGRGGPGEVEDHPLTIAPYRLTAASTSVAESSTSVKVTVTLAPAQASSVQVPWSVVAGTATAGADYVGASGTATIAAGETTADITVALSPDTLDENDETFTVALNPSCGVCVVGNPQVTISDDDAPPSISVADVQMGEGSTPVAFAPTLSSPTSFPVVVAYETVAGTASSADFTGVAGSVTITAGAVSASVQVPITADTLDEADEQFALKLTAVSHATFADDQATATIEDDDAPPTVSIADLAIAEGDRASWATLGVSLTTASSHPVDVRYMTTDGTARAGTDYVAASGVLRIEPGATTARLRVRIIGDRIREAPESFSVKLRGALNATLGTSRAMVSIADDDRTRGPARRTATPVP